MPDTRHEPIRVGIGTPLDRVDGPDKVTGQAHYAAEYAVPNMLYGVIVSGRIARGRITGIDETAARAVPGVVEVLTHRNRPSTPWLDRNYKDELNIPGDPFRALESEHILFSGQPVALVLAETFEAARFAASLVDVSYEAAAHNIDFEASLAERFLPSKKRNSYHPPKNHGDADAAFAAAELKHEARYHLATEHHNPMEMHATTVDWHGDGTLTVYDKNQGSQGVQSYLCNIFGFSKKELRVVNAFVGGAFGSGLRPQYQVYLAVMAAKHTQRSVRVVMTRQQMFTHAHRPEADYTIRLGAEATGKLTSIDGDATTSTSRFENNMEDIVIWGMINYASPNMKGEYCVAPRDTYTSADMRAPGAATGMTLFEIAMDELAYKAKVDPLDFRLLNYSDIDAMYRTPFTSKALREAYRDGAAAFGWDSRSPEPRSMKEGRELIGWGMATGLWTAEFVKTSAKAKLTADGRLEITSATSDIGTGTGTVLVLVAADTLGLPPDRISVRIGDSDLPHSPVQGGSRAAASGGAAVQLACEAVGKRLLKAAEKVDGQPLHAARSIEDVIFADGRMILKSDPSKAVSCADAMQAAGLEVIEEEQTAQPGLADRISQMTRSRNVHSAVFAEVRVDEELGQIRVTRIVNAVAAGRIINPKTARSQILGGVVMGMGMALHEETLGDNRLGRWMNHNLAEYHIPVNADVHDIQVIFVDEPDPDVTPLGVKGVGEIGIVSTAAAIANAIFHATGQRHRSLPITIDKLIGT
ncbi:xanthine dehydrogenase family protein molybdopterin-binding subunit [Rubellimicrobium rubrum]|uniref:Xanthine dehydrogenase family protein molybdopterin-binding subunit n=1 Tax=Rubellimicrobium rubrum TaxID=2585369 RepID=A0A5C4MWX9_9RHOB|nr:xanthine dehydrogenase family protein molybdopterin-binding subunit [Rubellimicrobium rubrum]TNC49114.1 xanthine dehydrogenase family protein molybdopterin-binding subunit [Rubellimicrobium rubrum]